jgi:hypothetical protein
MRRLSEEPASVTAPQYS